MTYHYFCLSRKILQTNVFHLGGIILFIVVKNLYDEGIRFTIESNAFNQVRFQTLT